VVLKNKSGDSEQETRTFDGMAANEQDGEEKEVTVLKNKSGDSEQEKQTFAEVELLKNKLEMKKFNSESSVNQIKQLNVSYPMFSLIESRQMQAGLRTKCARDRDLHQTCGGSEPGLASATCCAEDGLTCDLSVTPHICVKKKGAMCPILKDAESPVCESGSICIATDGSQEGVCKLKNSQPCVKATSCSSGCCSLERGLCDEPKKCGEETQGDNNVEDLVSASTCEGRTCTASDMGNECPCQCKRIGDTCKAVFDETQYGYGGGCTIDDDFCRG